MKKINILIVDDEKNSRELLALIIENNFENITHIDYCSNITKAQEFMAQEKYDYLFVDIHMPNGDGFEFVSSIPFFKGKIVFITAYDQYAIKAFKFGAVNYFLKPFNEDEIVQFLSKSFSNLISLNVVDDYQEIVENYKNFNSRSKKIALSTFKGLSIIDIESIIRCESDGKYTSCFILNQTNPIVVSKNIGEFDAILSAYSFLRVHNSHIININYVKEYINGRGGYIIMENNDNIPISQRKRDDFLKFLPKI